MRSKIKFGVPSPTSTSSRAMSGRRSCAWGEMGRMLLKSKTRDSGANAMSPLNYLGLLRKKLNA